MGLKGKTSDVDDVVGGFKFKVPARTQVAWSALAIIRNPGVFGQNADVFEPRWWLEADPSELRQMETAYGLVFVTGTRWECLGKRLAYLGLGKVLFVVIDRLPPFPLVPMAREQKVLINGGHYVSHSCFFASILPWKTP